MKNAKLFIYEYFFFLMFFSIYTAHGMSLDKQFEKAGEEGILSAYDIAEIKSDINVEVQNPKNAESQEITPNVRMDNFLLKEADIEEVTVGYYKTYFPKGYGRNNIHSGIWNAIPFVVFNEDTLEVRLGLIFEHRQVGFVPDNWIETSLTAKTLPVINFSISGDKIFLNFTQGSAQWRSTVVLSDEQIKALKLYANYYNNSSDNNVFTVIHKFKDGMTRPYIIGATIQRYLNIMIQLYTRISQLPNINKLKNKDNVFSVGFFDELSNQESPNVAESATSQTEGNETNIQEKQSNDQSEYSYFSYEEYEGYEYPQI